MYLKMHLLSVFSSNLVLNAYYRKYLIGISGSNLVGVDLYAHDGRLSEHIY